MSLHINKLATECHVPQRHRSGAELVDRLARGRFARDLGEHLGPSLVRQPAIVRIRRLPLRVVIPASELNEDALSLAWRQAFAKALFTALAYPSGVGPFEVFRAESMASFVASAIRDLLDGTAATQWQYAEFEEIFRLGSTQAALALICQWPRQSLAVLLELAQRGVLDRLLARFDDLSLERIFALLEPHAEIETEALSVSDLVAAAKLALTHLPQKTIALRTRAYALSLFVEGRRAPPPVRSPCALFHALLALAVILNEDVFWPGTPHGELWSQRLPSNVTALLESIIKEVREGRPESPQLPDRPTQSPQLAELNSVLLGLRSELKVPPPSAGTSEVRWISSECCGLFFLVSTLMRRGWIPAWRQLGDFQVGGVACLVAGLALGIIGKFDAAVPSMDSGLSLFAGYLGDPDIAHLRRVFQEFPRDVRLQVLQAALPDELADDAAENWRATFERLAGTLLVDFAHRIRGFRQATRESIVRSFIAQPGRIRIEPERIVVAPSPSPLYVALHVSGMDTPVEVVSWLGERRLEFELGDL